MAWPAPRRGVRARQIDTAQSAGGRCTGQGSGPERPYRGRIQPAYRHAARTLRDVGRPAIAAQGSGRGPGRHRPARERQFARAACRGPCIRARQSAGPARPPCGARGQFSLVRGARPLVGSRAPCACQFSPSPVIRCRRRRLRAEGSGLTPAALPPPPPRLAGMRKGMPAARPAGRPACPAGSRGDMAGWTTCNVQPRRRCARPPNAGL